MYLVSPQYNEQNFRQVRNASHVKIAFGVVDPQGAILSNPTDNGHLDYSAVDRVDMGIGVSQTYQTLEHNRFILDGKNTLAEHTDFLFQGYVGNLISNAAGIWETPPTVTIEFDDYTKFSALTFNFDTTMDEYPTEMQITAYKDGVVVSDETVYPNKAENWIYDTELPTLNKLVVIMKKSLRPYRRARILSLLWGFTQELTEADISECTMQHTVEMLSANLPKFTFNFTMLDQSKRYDPESPDTLWDYLESLQPVNVQIGQDLDDGTIEWIPLCNLYTTGDVSVGAQGVVTEVTFQTKALLNHLDTKFTHGLWRPNNPISLYDLAQEVIAEVEYDKTVILDDVLKTIYTSTPLPIESVAVCLQLIANAGMCVLDTNRSGAISITPYQTDAQDFILDFHSMTDPPSTSKVPPLRDVVTSYTSFVRDSEEARLAEAVVQDTVDGDIITIKHQAATDQYVVESETYKLTNLISNGNFETDISGWVVNGSGTLSKSADVAYIGSYSLKCVASNANTYCGPKIDVTSLLNMSHKYYLLSHGMCTVLGSSGLWYGEIGRTESGSNVYVGIYGEGNPTASNQWLRGCAYIDFLNSSVTAVWISPTRFRDTGAAGDTIYQDGICLVDLTETFGEGNEPDKAWCDTHLNYFEGTIYISKDGYVANNLITNGSFEENMDGWTQIGNATYSMDTNLHVFGTNSVKMLTGETGTYASLRYYLDISILTIGHKYYASCYQKRVQGSVDNVSTALQYRNDSSSALKQVNLVNVSYDETSTFYKYSVLHTLEDIANFAKLSFELRQEGTAEIVEQYMDGVCLVDLTETFGAGNEPSKEWCDANISFFEGWGIINPNSVKEIRPYTYATELVMTQSLPGESVSYMIKGHPLNQSTVDVSKRYNELGQDCMVENELVDTYEKAVAYADWVAGINQRRNDYDIPNRGFIELDTQDDITIESNFESQVLATVTSNEINYNGAISGRTKCMIVKKG